MTVEREQPLGVEECSGAVAPCSLQAQGHLNLFGQSHQPLQPGF